MAWIHPAQNTENCQDLVNTVMKLWSPQYASNFLTEKLFDSKEGLYMLHGVSLSEVILSMRETQMQNSTIRSIEKNYMV